MFAYALARRLPGLGHRNIVCFAYNPGLMLDTGLYGQVSRSRRLIYAIVLPLLAMVPRPGFSYAKRSGRFLARLVRDSPSRVSTGSYISLGKPTHSSKESYSLAEQDVLWNGTHALLDDIRAKRKPALT